MRAFGCRRPCSAATGCGARLLPRPIIVRSTTASGADPLHGASDSVRALTEAALARSEAAPFAPHLHAALEATKSVVQASAAFARSTDLLVVDDTAEVGPRSGGI